MYEQEKSDTEPEGIENATHNTFAQQTLILSAFISRIPQK
jgi:hypothetical protein